MSKLLKEKTDITTALLLLFTILFIALFHYLYNLEKNIQIYTKNHKNMMKLELLDKEIDHFCYSVNRFNNYDKINHTLNEFQSTLFLVKKNLLQDHPSNKILIQKLAKIQQEFEKKRENIEYFKSLNASLINCSHFLLDLQIGISEEKSIPLHLKNFINETLFYILRFITDEYMKKNFILQKLQKIKKIKKSNTSVIIDEFYKYAAKILEDRCLLKKTSKEILNSNLKQSLEDLNKLLYNKYTGNLFLQKFIVLLFFVATVVVLIALIISHLYSLKKERELYAFKYAVEHSDNSVVITDPKRNILFVNDVFEKTTGYTKQEALGENPRILKSDQHDESFYKELNEKLDRGEKWEGEFVNKRKDGSLFYEKASIVPVFLNKKLLSYLAIKLDITKYIEQNIKLAQAATIFENTEEAIIITDAEKKITSINPAFTKIYGYTIEDIKCKELNSILFNAQHQHFLKRVWESIKKEGLWRGKIVNRAKDGRSIPLWSTIKKISNTKNQINYVVVQTDLREIENSQAKANYLAYHDPLTGLYNRIHFEEYLSHALSVAKRNKTTLAILFIDLDRFKAINDSLGHSMGDEILLRVAKRLKTTLRESDFISRWGGDEFVIILENLASISETAVVASNIIDALKEPINIDPHHLVVTASIGISLFPENAQDANNLIKYADSAMYFAKDTGKNNFKYYTDELSKEIQNRLNIDMALHNAIKKSEIHMLFQPQYTIKNKKIVSLEALVRWENQQLGKVSPEKFIPIAEESGTIVALGYYIFEESCKAFSEIKKRGVDIEQIAINVSSVQFKEPFLLETFVSIAKRHNIKPSEIEIEITERFIMEQTVTNINILQNFRNYGFKISIDDFGTGYSSMSYLKQLPVDTIKIDKSFIDGIDTKGENSDNIVIKAIIALSKALGYMIVAEGIETNDQEIFLKGANCDIGQGYLFSKPISCEEIIERFST